MAIQNRIRELRKNLNLSQIGLSLILGTTQQTVSRMEISGDIPTDLLIKMSRFFNATTDYILGISEYKRDLSGQLRMNHEMDMYYDIILRYQQLSTVNRRTLLVSLDRLEQAQYEQSTDRKESDDVQKGDTKDDEDSSV
ncbi:MAG: helix-turn-helix transcriptional regulator [Lachnospiraceae bacterium]|nr:helix-turn-helix transcriptional regulator [Lachnospiraceae bacterium]